MVGPTQFYSHLILTKKGALGHVWMAATLGERSVSKRYASTAKIVRLCDSIHEPSAPFALRLSAHLMLGVTRVFARKSEIVLADSDSILNVLHKLSAKHGVARFQDGAGAHRSQGNMYNNITLGEPGPGDFHKITLPGKRNGKKRNNRTSTAGWVEENRTEINPTSLPVSLRIDPSKTIDVGSNTPEMHSLPWHSGQGSWDVGCAMEMAFPTVSQPTGSGDGTEGTPNQPGSQGDYAARSQYRAREQDITIPSAQQQTYFDADNLLNPSSAEKEHFLLPAPGEISLSASGGANSGGLESDLFMDSPLAEIADFQNTFGRAILDRNGEAPGGNVPQPDPLTPPKQVIRVSGERDPPTSMQRVPHTLQAGAPTAFNDVEIVGNRLDQKQPSSLGKFTGRPPRHPKTAARETRVKFDESTELPTSFIRECLNDTSSIMADPTNPACRPKKKRRGSTPQSTLSHAFLQSTLISTVADSAPELLHMWKQLISDSAIDGNNGLGAAEKQQYSSRVEHRTESHRQGCAVSDDTFGVGHAEESADFSPMVDPVINAGLDQELVVPSGGQDHTPSQDRKDALPIGENAMRPGADSMEPERLRDGIYENVRASTKYWKS